MESPITHNRAASQFEWPEGDLKGVAQYRREGSTLVVTHIIVPPALGGRGVGSSLAAAVARFAREEGLTLHPQCAFMAAYLERHPE